MTVFELIDAGDAARLRDLLAREPEQAALHDDQGLTALMRAAYRGGDVFDAVRDAGPPLEPFDRIMVGESDGLPSPDARTPDGFTPLHLAAFAGNVEAARKLLADGADPNVVASATFARVTPLGTCAFAGANEVAKLLLEHGADTELTGAGDATPLRSARANGNDELCKLLLQFGASEAASS